MSGLSHTPGKRARGKTLRGFESRLIRQKNEKPRNALRDGAFSCSGCFTYFVGNCVIFIAEPIKVATSAMWLGTIKVVVASAATLE